MARFGLLLLLCIIVSGCVERRIYVRSDPPGADVYIDGEFVGKTRDAKDPDGPLYVNFIYYGTREYTLRKPGFQTVSGSVKLEVPWYEYPPLDFFAEVLTPWVIVDEHYVDVKFVPAEPADVANLYHNAREYRDRSRPEDRFEYWAWWARKPLAPVEK